MMVRSYKSRHGWRICTVLITITLIALYSQPVCAQMHSLAFLEESITIAPDPETGGRMVTAVTLRNDGPAVTGLEFRAILETEDGGMITVPVTSGEAGSTMAGYAIQAFTITLEGAGITKSTSGYLVAQAQGDANAATVPLTVEIAEGKTYRVLGIGKVSANSILWLAGGCAAASAIAVLIWIWRAGACKKLKAGYVTLITDWQSSLASTLTVFAGTLSTLVSASIFPESPSILTKNAFQTLQVFFPILVVIAAFVVTILSNAYTKPDPQDATKQIMPVYPLVIGTPLALAAFTGELASLVVLFEELTVAGHLARFVTTLTQVFFVAVLALGLGYGVRGLVTMVRESVLIDRGVVAMRGESAPRAHLP